MNTNARPAHDEIRIITTTQSDGKVVASGVMIGNEILDADKAQEFLADLASKIQEEG